MISESMHQPMFPGDQFASHYATVNGLRMHYIDEGQGDAVVLVHGNPTWWYYFRNLITVLRKRFRVIVPDHIGSGMSDKPRSFEYTLKNHIDNLAALFDRLHLSTTSLVLHDWGGAIGLGAAAQREVGLEKLVILNIWTVILSYGILFSKVRMESSGPHLMPAMSAGPQAKGIFKRVIIWCVEIAAANLLRFWSTKSKGAAIRHL